MRITVIHNPGAGDEEHTAEDIVQALESAGHDTRYKSTRKDRVDRALDKPADLILAAGGDGTVRKVAVALAGRATPMAILPLGTANNVVKAMGAVSGLHDLLEGLPRALRQHLDLGVARAGSEEQHFIEGAGGGCFARIVRSGSRSTDRPPYLTGNKIDRALALLRLEVARAEPHPWKVRVDGKDVSGEFLLVEVMNIRFIGPNVPLANRAHAGDGLLDVVAVTSEQRGELLDYLDARIRGEAPLLELPAVRGRRVELAVDGELFHADDGAWPEEDDERDDAKMGDNTERRGREPAISGATSVEIEVAAAGVELLVVPKGVNRSRRGFLQAK